VARYAACRFYIQIPFNEDLYWTDIQRTVSFCWHQNSHSKLTWAPPISKRPPLHINHGLRHHILTIDRLNHCDSVVLTPPTITPTISRSGANDVEAIACLLHSVGKSKGDDAHATTTINHLTPTLCWCLLQKIALAYLTASTLSFRSWRESTLIVTTEEPSSCSMCHFNIHCRRSCALDSSSYKHTTKSENKISWILTLSDKPRNA
jgi:hypothetical protein